MQQSWSLGLGGHWGPGPPVGTWWALGLGGWARMCTSYGVWGLWNSVCFLRLPSGLPLTLVIRDYKRCYDRPGPEKPAAEENRLRSELIRMLIRTLMLTLMLIHLQPARAQRRSTHKDSEKGLRPIADAIAPARNFWLPDGGSTAKVIWQFYFILPP